MLVSVRSNMFRNITAHFQHSAACVHHVSMSYLPRNGPVSARHSQQRNRARDGNGQRFAHFTCSRASAWLPAYLMIPVRAGGPMMSRSRAFLRTAQRATCGGGCVSISVRWHSRERESYRIAQCFSEGEGLARDGQIAPEFHTVPGWRELLAPRCAL